MSSTFPSRLEPRPIARSPASFVPLIGGRWVMAGVGAAAAADAILLLWADLRIDLSAVSIGFVVLAIVAAITCFALRSPATKPRRIARDLIESVSLFAAICLLGAVASYPLAVQGRAFVDPALERVDLGLHFHWLTWYELVARHGWLQQGERAAYLSIYLTPAILLGYFAWTGRRADSRLFLATYWLAATITLAIFPFLPAAGPFATLWHGAMPYMPLSALYQDQVILELRQHALRSVDLGALHGLVCAPSFHAASAILYIATGWKIPRLRWPIAALNIAMLLATPVEGTHYLVDILSGVMVALVALLLTPLLVLLVSTKSSVAAPPAGT